MTRVPAVFTFGLMLCLAAHQAQARPQVRDQQASLSTRSLNSQSSHGMSQSSRRPGLVRSDVPGQRLLNPQGSGRPGLVRSDVPGQRLLNPQGSGRPSLVRSDVPGQRLLNPQGSQANLSCKVMDHGKRVDGFWGDCRYYSNGINKRYSYVARNAIRPSRPWHRQPTSDLGRAIERFRKANEGKPGQITIERSLLRQTGMPMHRALESERQVLARDVKAERRGQKRKAAPDTTDYGSLNKRLELSAEHLDRAQFQLTYQLPLRAHVRDFKRAVIKAFTKPWTLLF